MRLSKRKALYGLCVFSCLATNYGLKNPVKEEAKMMLRVLIADDSFVMRNNLRKIFEKNGLKVVGEASNGEEVCRAYDRLLPDLVTMDINMPIMDGIAAVKKIIAKHPQATIVVVSAEGQKNTLFKAIKSGAKHFLVKPITIEKTMKVIEEVLS